MVQLSGKQTSQQYFVAFCSWQWWLYWQNPGIRGDSEL